MPFDHRGHKIHLTAEQEQSFEQPRDIRAYLKEVRPAMLHLIRVDPHHPGSLDPEDDIVDEFESFISWTAPSSGKSRLAEWELYNAGPRQKKLPHAKWLLLKLLYFLKDERTQRRLAEFAVIRAGARQQEPATESVPPPLDEPAVETDKTPVITLHLDD